MDSMSRDGSEYVTDEKFNTYSHLVGFILAVLGTAHLVVQASLDGSVWHITGFAIYGFTLIALFFASLLHHGVRGSEKLDLVLRAMDYCAIYLLIAGTVTPVTLVLIRGSFGWTLFGVSWLIALGGVAFKIARPRHAKGISNTLYLCGGWLAAFTALPVYREGGALGLGLLASGGVLYSMGAVIFAIEKPNPLPGTFGFHEIWHVFVMMGAFVHYLLMLWVVLPYA